MTRSERRIEPRAVSRVALVLDHAAEELSAATENISASGAYCTVGRFIPLMTKLRVRLELPSGRASRAIHCQGVVVRIEPPQETPRQQRYQVAVFFNDLSDRDRTHLAQYVQQHLQSPASSR